MAKRKIRLSTGEVEEVEVGSGNVFKDLGYADAEERLYKGRLVGSIEDAIIRKGLKQVDAAKILGIGQPNLSRMIAGNYMSVSVDKLTEMLIKLGFRVEMVLHAPEGDREGGFEVKTA